MDSLLNREKYLQQLFEDNFVVARYCRKTMDSLSDDSLKQYFQSLASKRSQFAIELGEEIKFYGGQEPYIPSGGYDRRGTEATEEDKDFKTRKCLGLNKASLQKYKEALCEVTDGSCREILIRHKAFIKNCIFELESLKTLLKYNTEYRPRNDSKREESSQI